MKDRGFTLIELLGVIIILGLLITLVLPKIVSSVKSSSKSTDELLEEMIYSAAKLYVEDNKNEYEKVNGNVYCIPLKTLIDKKYLEENIKFSNDEDVSNISSIEVIYNDGFEYTLKNNNACKQSIMYSESVLNGANPELYEGLTPVVYDGSNWKVTSIQDKWYDYTNQEWANAVILKNGITKNVNDIVNVSNEVEAMFVWVPRFEYKIDGQYGKHIDGMDGTQVQPGEIKVRFISKNKISPTNGYRVHPAFNFDGKDLNGIWVGKFETTGTATEPTILPSVPSLRGQNINEQFTTSQKFSIYLNNLNVDPHMARNSEWVAASYLSQSRYGKYGNSNYIGTDKEVMMNNCENRITGIGADAQNSYASTETCTTNTYETAKGQAASTTGNITGIYDMNAGSWESVMGVYNNTIGNSGINFATIDSKYYDNYTNSNVKTACNGGICYGHALSETLGWYRDYDVFVNSDEPWLLRGGVFTDTYNSGVFFVSHNTGTDVNGYYGYCISFRVIMVGI